MSLAPPAGFLSAQTADDAEQRLEPGKPIGRELRGGQSHSYRVPLQQGDLLRVRVDQRQIDVVLVFRSPDGKTLASIDFSTRAPERGSLIAEVAGEHRVEVRARRPAAPPGRYEIVCEELRPATAADRDRKKVEEALNRAQKLQVEGDGKSLRESLALYEEAAEAARRGGDADLEAACLAGAGWISVLLGSHTQAMEVLTRARALHRANGDRFGEALVCNSLGSANFGLGKLDAARQFYEESLAIRREIGDALGAAVALCNLGRVYTRTSQSDKAVEALPESAQLARSVGDLSTEGSAEYALGVAYGALKDSARAEVAFRRALELRRADGDRRGEVETIRALGILAMVGGEYEKALAEFERCRDLAREIGEAPTELFALVFGAQMQIRLGRPVEAITAVRQRIPLLRKTGDRRAEALCWKLIASYYVSAGEPAKAVEPALQGLELSRAVGDRVMEAEYLAGLGALYGESLGEGRNPGKAVEYFEAALAILQSLGWESAASAEPTVLNSIGRVHALSGDLDRALSFYQQSLECWAEKREPRVPYITLDDIGEVYAQLHDWDRAAAYYARALEASRKTGDRRWENETLSHQASLKRHVGDLDGSRRDIESVVESVETVRMRILEGSVRSTFFASVRRYFELYVEILMRLHERWPADGFDALAFQASERTRSRSFLDALNEARWDPREGADPALLEEARALRNKILLETEKTGQPLPAGSRGTLQSGAVEGLLAEYETLEARIRTSNPRYAALTQPASPSASEIADRLLGPDTVLLEYFLGEERSFLWALDTSGLTAYELPGRATLEDLARRAYASVSSSPKGRPSDGAALRALGRILVGPVAGQYSRKRFVVAADGALAYLPFGALPAPELEAGKEGGRLAALHEIVQIPSAGVLAVLRQDPARRPAPRTLAVFADPVFSKDDARIPAAHRSTAPEPLSGGSDVTRAFADLDPEGRTALTRLPFTRAEATAILSLVAPDQRRQALDFDANREAALASDLSEFRYLHFATHGVLDPVHPDLSGVVLSLVDRAGKDRPGFLSAMEVFRLRLQVEMVVLSACRTALGREIRGEGLVGLTRAFMYAGAPRVVASLWRVDDSATAELMKRFYEGMLGPRKLRPAAALREAQLAVMKQNRWKDPYYWAAFVLQGEWN